ncbi:UNVERIFIED_CONTAM: hypothetical protein FKN15_010327 [Acipenser sinensis]
MFTTIWQSRELNTKKLLSKDLTSREHKKCVSFHRVTQPLPHHPLTIKRSTASTNLSNVNLLPLTSVESSDSLSSLDSLETDTAPGRRGTAGRQWLRREADPDSRGSETHFPPKEDPRLPARTTPWDRKEIAEPHT